MPTVVGILTFISMVITTTESLKATVVVIFQLLWVVDISHSVEHEKSLITSGGQLTHFI